MKKCSRCGVVKSVSEFGKDKQKRDGLTSKCKICKRAEGRAWIAKRREIDPTYGLAWTRKNPERRKLIAKAYNERHPGRHKKYRLESPHSHKAASHKFRARKLGIESSLTGGDVLSAVEDQGGACAICQAELGKSYTIDHVVPIARGGDNSKENIQILCRGCNARKGKLLNSEFLSVLLSNNYIG